MKVNRSDQYKEPSMKLINSPLNSIDYEHHPGFVAFTQAIRNRRKTGELLNKQLYQAIESIDQTFSRYLASPSERGKELDAAFAQTLRDQITAVQSLCQPCFESGSIGAEALRIALEMLFQLLIEECLVLRALKQNKVDSGGFGSEAHRVKQELESEGVALRKVPKQYIEALWKWLEPVRARLSAVRANDPTGRECNISIGFDQPWGPLIIGIFQELKFIDALQLIYNGEIEPLFCAAHMCHPEERWYKDCYSDVGVSTTRMAYAHYDSGFEVCKAIIYLSEVGPDQGPFSYVPKSRTPHPSPFLLGFSKCLDKAFKKAVSPQVWKQSGRYYRPVFKVPELRREFAHFPAPVRVTSHFGDDVEDYGLLSEQLGAAEQTVTNEQGNCMIFDGDKVIHRGGWVRSGDRWVLNVGFRIKQFAGIFQKS